MILEAVYEPIFLNVAHGFRPKRSCHTALKFIKMEFNGARWFVEGDIKGCFDNIDHQILVGLIRNKIKDARIIKLIYKFLKAGYMENWKYHKTYSGTPQGGIISPLLANIYLHELDKFVMKLKEDFDKPNKSAVRIHPTTHKIVVNFILRDKIHVGSEVFYVRKRKMNLPIFKLRQTAKKLMSQCLTGTFRQSARIVLLKDVLPGFASYPITASAIPKI